ncbi:MAG: hypothetical protein LQ349_000661 [Xanthoria aureola]|nr:MAG: hypothetical protein LQ349_000661 [Xanthoria aureola]
MSTNSSTTVGNVFTPSRNNPTTESSLQTPSKTTKPSVAHNDVRGYMEQHGMHINTKILEEPGREGFYATVMSVADEQRPSGVKPESAKRWPKRTANLGDYNEATMLMHILPLVIKDGRHLSVHGPTLEQASSVKQHMDDFWEDFEDSGLDYTADQEFRRTFLPNAYAQIGYEDKIALELAKQKGIKNPKPDRAYGLAMNSIPPPKGRPGLLRNETQSLLNAIPNLQHVFFLLEAVSSAGSITKAMNQACRGGTVAIVIQRRLLEVIGQLGKEEGPDQKTYVYTATIDDSTMAFWVNFAFLHVPVEGKPYVTYHMERVYTYALHSPDAVLYLRRVCHNILDWGVRTRRPMLETRCQQIYEFERQAIEEDVARALEMAEQEKMGKGKKRKYNTPGKVSQGL